MPVEGNERINPKTKYGRIARHILYWVSVLSFFSLFDLLISGRGIYNSIILNAVYLPQDILLVYLILYFIIPRIYLRKKYLLFVLSLGLVLILNILFSFATDYAIIPKLNIEVEESQTARRIFSSILSFTFIEGLASFIKLIKINNKNLLNKENAEARFHKAELALLRSQVNPHFLFNVFNNIDELIYKDKDKASETLAFLSDSLRYVLQEQDNEFVPVRDEIAFIGSYLKVAIISFDDQEFISFETDAKLDLQPVAPMLFIPFVENSIKHCNRKSESPGIIIRIFLSGNHICLSCVNYIRNDKQYGPSTGLGLANIRKRLDLLYSGNYKLNIGEVNGKYIADLKIPVV